MKDEIIMASDIPSKTTHEEHLADLAAAAEAKAKEEHQEKVDKWLIRRPEIGVLNKEGGVKEYYYYNRNDEMVMVEELANPTLGEWLPYEFFEEFMDTPAAKLLDVPVIAEYDSLGFCGDYNEGEEWQGKQQNVHTWCLLENGKAVGWNENPSRGWSFPVITYKKASK